MENNLIEVVDIVVFDTNINSGIIDVVFKTSEDGDDEVREDVISILDVKDIDNTITTKIYDLFRINNQYDTDYDDDYSLETEELIDMLNEYYREFPDRIPKKS